MPALRGLVFWQCNYTRLRIPGLHPLHHVKTVVDASVLVLWRVPPKKVLAAQFVVQVEGLGSTQKAVWICSGVHFTPSRKLHIGTCPDYGLRFRQEIWRIFIFPQLYSRLQLRSDLLPNLSREDMQLWMAIIYAQESRWSIKIPRRATGRLSEVSMLTIGSLAKSMTTSLGSR